MKIYLFLAIFLLISFNESANCAPLISGISTNEINIDTKFKGAQILLFGAKGDAGNIVITVRGPKKNFLVTKKQKILAVWYNGTRINFENSYSFFSIFSTFNNGEIQEDIMSDLELGKDFLEFSTNNKISDKNNNDFKAQLIEKMEKNNLYNNNVSKVEFLDETLFKVMLNFPKNIVRGIYTVELYLIKENTLISFQSIPIYVNQIGISAKISDFAIQQDMIYGIIAVMLALIVGWLANYIFARFIGK
jgi:uncharacterized protein (TIGR02186 family)